MPTKLSLCDQYLNNSSENRICAEFDRDIIFAGGSKCCTVVRPEISTVSNTDNVPVVLRIYEKGAEKGLQERDVLVSLAQFLNLDISSKNPGERLELYSRRPVRPVGILASAFVPVFSGRTSSNYRVNVLEFAPDHKQEIARAVQDDETLTAIFRLQQAAAIAWIIRRATTVGTIVDDYLNFDRNRVKEDRLRVTFPGVDPENEEALKYAVVSQSMQAILIDWDVNRKVGDPINRATLDHTPVTRDDVCARNLNILLPIIVGTLTNRELPSPKEMAERLGKDGSAESINPVDYFRTIKLVDYFKSIGLSNNYIQLIEPIFDALQKEIQSINDLNGVFIWAIMTEHMERLQASVRE